MALIELQQELHANTRRTRITYLAWINGKPVALKCYRKPLFGLIHWLRARHRGRKIREAGGPVPPVLFSGWVPAERCFGFGTAFLEGSKSMRDALRNENDRQRQKELVYKLGGTVANLHLLGIEQPDGNLTNFLLGTDGATYVVDEDDVKVYPEKLPVRVAMNNLGNIAARLPGGELVMALSGGYLSKLSPGDKADCWDNKLFTEKLVYWRNALDEKRAKRNIAPREFD